MKNNKLDIFEQNAEFFERFNNSLEDTAEDRHDRTRFTVTGLENKVEFAVTNAQGRIKKAEDDAIANIVDTTQSVGTGKYLREGAYGVGGSTTSSSEDLKVGTFGGGGNYTIMRSFRSPNAGFELRNFYSQDRFELRKWWGGVWNNPVEILHNSNTRVDKNNVLHSGTGTPLNTLNVSDMAQDVVDRDDVTVTSGAVYRSIQELRAEIALLKGKLNE